MFCLHCGLDKLAMLCFASLLFVHMCLDCAKHLGANLLRHNAFLGAWKCCASPGALQCSEGWHSRDAL